MIERTLRLAVNPDLIDKNIGGNQALFAEGFRNVELRLDELAAVIQQGKAFCAQVTGRRNANNFLASDIVAVDVDSGMTIDEALKHPIVKEHASLIYTTVSHQPDAHRFRIVFACRERSSLRATCGHWLGHSL